MTAVPVNLTIEQGATFLLGFTWAKDEGGSPGEPVDLTYSSIRMQIRKAQQSPVLIEALSTGPSPMISHGGTDGHVEVKIPASSTNLLSTKSALYDLEVVMPSTDVFRVIEGKVTVKPNITQVEGEPIVRP